MGFDFKDYFTPPTILLGLLLCPCMWGISTQLLQHLPSYWGFSDLRARYLHMDSTAKHSCSSRPWMWDSSSKSPQCHAPTAPASHNCHSSNIAPETSLRSLTKVYTVKAMVFPVVLYGCESWTIKKPESQRIDTFELWCWKKLLSTLKSKEVKLVNLKGMQP